MLDQYQAGVVLYRRLSVITMLWWPEIRFQVLALSGMEALFCYDRTKAILKENKPFLFKHPCWRLLSQEQIQEVKLPLGSVWNTSNWGCYTLILTITVMFKDEYWYVNTSDCILFPFRSYFILRWLPFWLLVLSMLDWNCKLGRFVSYSFPGKHSNLFSLLPSRLLLHSALRFQCLGLVRRSEQVGYLQDERLLVF